MGQVASDFTWGTPYFYEQGVGGLPLGNLQARSPLLANVTDPLTYTRMFEDFMTTVPATSQITGWLTTIATSGSIVQDTTNPNGALTISAGAVTAAQGITLQTIGSPFKVAAGCPVAFEAIVTFTGLSTTPKLQFFIGLCAQSTAIIASSTIASLNMIGFGGVTTTGVINSIINNAGVALTGTAVTIANAQKVRFGFYSSADLGATTFYINGAVVSTLTGQIPTVVLAPALVLQANATVTPVVSLDAITVFGYRQ